MYVRTHRAAFLNHSRYPGGKVYGTRPRFLCVTIPGRPSPPLIPEARSVRSIPGSQTSRYVYTHLTRICHLIPHNRHRWSADYPALGRRITPLNSGRAAGLRGRLEAEMSKTRRWINARRKNEVTQSYKSTPLCLEVSKTGD